jgi:DNA invertase Pin-like site-specific DNA recombinase
MSSKIRRENMTTYAYLRVSTTEQDEQNQKLGIDEKAKILGLKINKYIIDKVSGTKEPNERNLGKLLKKTKEGDVVIISELSRFGRRLFMLFRILEGLLNKGVKVYSVKDGYNLDNTLQSKVLAFAFGMAAEIERDMISKRTREALALRKAQGKKLGRPLNSKTKNPKLNKYKDQIIKLYQSGVSKSKIAKKYKVCHKTIRKYIRIYTQEL